MKSRASLSFLVTQVLIVAVSASFYQIQDDLQLLFTLSDLEDERTIGLGILDINTSTTDHFRTEIPDRICGGRKRSVERIEARAPTRVRLPQAFPSRSGDVLSRLDKISVLEILVEIPNMDITTFS